MPTAPPPSPPRRASPSTPPSLAGSINLIGGRIDDLKLKDYHETVDPTSPIITLLSPAGGPDGYFVEQGWVAAAGSRHRRADRHNACGPLDGDARRN